MKRDPIYMASRESTNFTANRFGKTISALVCTLGAVTLAASCQATAKKEVQVTAKEEVKVVQVAREVPKNNCGLRNFDGGRTFIVEAWGLPDANFDFGEPLRLQMRASAAAYMSVFYVSTSCKVTRLLNNRPVKATEIINFPTLDSGLVMTVKPPAGEEAFYFIATREPIDFLSGGAGGDILGQAAGVASLDLNPAQFYRRLEDVRGRINPESWSSKTLRTRVIGH